MIRKLFLLILSALMINSTAGAGEITLAPTSVNMTSLEQYGSAMRNYSPLVKKVTRYCRRDCDWCRSDCYNTYRINCYGPSCMPNFVICMRGCWENICRYC